MYTLRTITPDGVQINECIGPDYIFICRDSAYDVFSDTFFNQFGIKHVADLCQTATETTTRCHGFIKLKNEDIVTLWKSNKYYIMSDSGKTFSNLSY